MSTIKVYPSERGGWIYEVWLGARLAVVGWCRTRAAAENRAALV